jgi:hypothetical protein
MRFHQQFLCDLIENEVPVPEEISQSLVSWSVASDDDS